MQVLSHVLFDFGMARNRATSMSLRVELIFPFCYFPGHLRGTATASAGAISVRLVLGAMRTPGLCLHFRPVLDSS